MSCFSCNRDSNTTPTETKIKRYEVALFSIDTTRFEQGIREIHPQYKVFLGESLPDEYGMNQLKNFVTDPLLRETYSYTLEQFPDLEFLNARFTKAFLKLRKELPDHTIPQVYTYVSGFDIRTPIKYTDSALIISLDLYLGSDFKPYSELGYPLYIINRLLPKYILADCFNEIGWTLLPESSSSTLLDAMIEQGKILYFTELMLPDESRENIITYNRAQFDWIISNEQNLWSFIIENQLLYSTEGKVLTMFMTDGPFTSGFSEQSPSRTGHWLGWQIVRNYMKNNRVTLEQLLKDTDSQKILQQSGYKPARI